jgi:hypothetical protein
MDEHDDLGSAAPPEGATPAAPAGEPSAGGEGDIAVPAFEGHEPISGVTWSPPPPDAEPPGPPPTADAPTPSSTAPTEPAPALPGPPADAVRLTLDAGADPSPTSWSEAASPPVPAGAPPRRSRVALIAIVAAIVVIAAGVPLAFVAGRSGRNQPTAGESSTPFLPSAGSPEPTTPPGPAVPTFTATAVSGGEVDIAWTPISDTTITGYSISRDGELVKSASTRDTLFRDFDVHPGTTYSYTIQSFGDTGHSPESAPVSVLTPPAPALKDARVGGSFVVHEKYTSENFTNYNVGDKVTEVWAFHPACKPSKGACDTRTPAGGNKQGLLKRTGANYAGDVTEPDQGRCGSTPLDEYLHITFEVTKADFSEGVWTAQKLTGLITITGQFSSSCITAHATQTITATRTN